MAISNHVYTYDPRLEKYKSKVFNHLYDYREKALEGKEIDLRSLAKDCTDVLQLLHTQEGIAICPNPLNCNVRVTGISFTTDEYGQVSTNLITESM